jgi:flavin-dependent dehydrogenase
MHWGTRITGITSDGVSVNGLNIRCRWLVRADGQNSRIRYWAGLESSRPGSRRFGYRCHYQVAPWSEFVEVYWTDCGQLYVTPVSNEEVCVALITREPHTRLENAFAVFPAIAKFLRGAELITREQGAISRTHALRLVHKGSRVLVGEASGSVDAITGDGLSMAFQHAQALVHALQNNDLATYQAVHRNIYSKAPGHDGGPHVVDGQKPVAATTSPPGTLGRAVIVRAHARHSYWCLTAACLRSAGHIDSGVAFNHSISGGIVYDKV